MAVKWFMFSTRKARRVVAAGGLRGLALKGLSALIRVFHVPRSCRVFRFHF